MNDYRSVKKEVRLSFSFLHIFLSLFLLILSPHFVNADESPTKETFTINYSNISAVEYVRFVSKVCQKNFLYNDADLQFTVSVVSEEPISANEVMSSLIQVLRIHNISLLEENGNLLIHTNEDVKQIPSVLSGKEKNKNNNALISQVFKIRNVNVNSIVALLQGMLSKASLMQALPETGQLIISDIPSNIAQVAKIIKCIDSSQSPLVIETYKAKKNPTAFLIALTEKIIAPIAEKMTFLLVPQPLTDIIFIISTPQLIEKSLSVLKSIDADKKHPFPSLDQENIFVYQLQKRSLHEMGKSITTLKKHLKDSGFPDDSLIVSLETMMPISQTHSLLFIGPNEVLPKLQEILQALDSPAAKPELTILYHSVNRSPQGLADTIHEIAKTLKETSSANLDLIAALEETTALESAQALLIAADTTTLAQIKEMLAAIDVPFSTTLQRLGKSSFFIYEIKNRTEIQLLNALREIATNLEKAKIFEEKSFLHSIENAKYIQRTNSILFTGSDEILQNIKSLLISIDIDQKQSGISKQFYLYQLQLATPQKTEKYLQSLAKNLEATDSNSDDIVEAIKTMKWMEDSHSFLFAGGTDTLGKIKELITTYDSADEQKKLSGGPTYFLYKLENTPGNVLEEDFENFANSLRNQKIENPDLLYVLDNVKWIKETNSLLLTGTPVAIDEAKELIVKYDLPRKEVDFPLNHENFFMYKTQNTSPEYIEDSLNEIASSLKKADLADPNLLSSIASMKYIETTDTLVFTGTQDSLVKVESLIKTIDIPQGAEEIEGKSTVLVYKIHSERAEELMSSIRTVADDLEKAGTADITFLNALRSMKYQKETNSLIFTGTPEALKKVRILVEKIDRPGGEKGGAYFVYKPLHLSGPALETILLDFVTHLKSSGFEDVELYQTIHSMKWVENTHSLIFSGNPRTIEEIKGLLVTFDTSDQAGPVSELQPFDNTSFLVYKLQYHKGDEIQTALKEVGKQLSLSAKKPDQLIDAINSIQWIEVTNSLLCSGDQDTITRLKELIKSLDVPLKQVFIEMLVIETSLDNLLEFGLDWGSKFNIKSKLAGSMNNFQYNPVANTVIPPFGTALNNISNGRLPLATDIPFSSGFDLGIIGDILLHKGKSFLSLGSLLRALQSDSQISVLMTPKIITQDSKPTHLFIGQNIPYQGSVVTNSGSNNVVTASLEYRDVGMDLTVTPVLGNADVVTLTINMENTDAPNTSTVTTFSAPSPTGITTSKTTMNTTVSIPNKKFLILSGMMRDRKEKTKNGIPCLGGLPLIGSAFSKNDRFQQKTNLVIFIRPHIINSYKDMISISQNQEDFFRDAAGTPTLENDFQEGIEQLKTYEDE